MEKITGEERQHYQIALKKFKEWKDGPGKLNANADPFMRYLESKIDPPDPLFEKWEKYQIWNMSLAPDPERAGKQAAKDSFEKFREIFADELTGPGAVFSIEEIVEELERESKFERAAHCDVYITPAGTFSHVLKKHLKPGGGE